MRRADPVIRRGEPYRIIASTKLLLGITCSRARNLKTRRYSYNLQSYKRRWVRPRKCLWSLATNLLLFLNRRSHHEDEFVVVMRTAAPLPARSVLHPRLGAVAFAFLVVAAATFGVNSTTASSVGFLVTTKGDMSSRVSPTQLFPIGTRDSSEPSGFAPPSLTAFPGYAQTYATDFTGTSLPEGWISFSGMASGDPGSQWGTAHVVVANGLLSLNSWRDPAYNNVWVNGGLCQCGVAKTYGAYFVRSRVTGPGPTIVELLWPTVGWPPEIDFNETSGVATGTSATTIWSVSHGQSQVRMNIDMTRWHTWGVIWTPTSVTYTVDGRAWGSFNVSAEVAHVPFVLHLQQQTWCSSNFACPTSPESSQIDWVAEYSIASTNLVTISPFQKLDWALTPQLRQQIVSLARRVQSEGDLVVNLTGYGDATSSSRHTIAIGRNRASAVKRYLLRVLTNLNDPAVVVSVTGSGRIGHFVTSVTTSNVVPSNG